MFLNQEQIDICTKGNFEDILSLVNDGCDKNTILCHICYYGHIEVVKYLIEKWGPNVRASAVLWTCGAGRLEVVKYLVEKCGVNISCQNNLAIRLASQNGHIQVVKYLVENCGVNVRSENDQTVWWASLHGHLEVVKYLVEKCEANARAENDYAVRWASANGHLEVVKYLVEKCEANARAENDWAVRWASTYCRFEVVKYLIEKCGAVLPEVNPKYERYLIVHEKGEKRRRCVMAKRIYFWWVQACYNPNFLCGQRSMYKGYREYLSMR